MRQLRKYLKDVGMNSHCFFVADCHPKTNSPLDIEKGLSDWRTINADPRKWATFEAVQFDNERIVRVTWGVVHTNGTKETALQTITFFLEKDGKVREYSHTHF